MSLEVKLVLECKDRPTGAATFLTVVVVSTVGEPFASVVVTVMVSLKSTTTRG